MNQRFDKSVVEAFYGTTEPLRALYRDLSKFEIASKWRAIGQLCNTLLPYFLLWGLAIFTVIEGHSYWITLGLALLAVPLAARTFIIFHDCCHGSFLKSPRANRFFGYLCGILMFTPYEDWQREHAAHHAHSGNLDRRGMGDIWTATVEEYRALPWHRRVLYRLYRNPLVMFGLGPLIVMVIVPRFWHRGARARERVSVVLTNLALLGILVTAWFTMGIGTYLAIQLPIIFVSGALGLWLFYVQHQFEGADWARHDEWDAVRSALQGSSYYKLPRILQWCTGNIGLHHVHHLRPGIPNYNLQRCCEETPLLRQVTPLTLRKSLSSVRLNLWDEREERLVSFGELKALSRVRG